MRPNRMDLSPRGGMYYQASRKDHSSLPRICSLFRAAVQTLWRINALSETGMVQSIGRVNTKVKFLLQPLIPMATASPVKMTSVLPSEHDDVDFPSWRLHFCQGTEWSPKDCCADSYRGTQKALIQNINGVCFWEF